MRKWLWAVLLVALALAVAGCGDDDDDGGDAQQAPSADPAEASGNVNWCIGKDTSGAYGTAIDLFKKENPDVTVKLVEEICEGHHDQQALQAAGSRSG